MASLTGQLVAETYKALLKTIDNDILTASEKQITDGFGGGSNVFIDSQGFLRANKYKVTNGLATQFLKADGSLDSNTYLTGITSSQIISALGYTPVTNARTLTINGTTYDLSANRSWTIEGTAAVWGNISGTLSNQTDLQTALNAKFNNPAGTISQYIRGDGSLATFPTITGGLPTGGTAGQILAKIDATNYNTEWIDNYATQTKNEVKLGQTLTKGTPAYVSSADGTNMIVSAASNTTEATSSKTLGLLETGGSTNALVKCVTFGLIAGLDTSTATAGDPVWLGPSGTLLYGIANKPVAPAHMVYIGVVTRVQSNNGEIFVNVQNGFEIEELHDVLIQSKANNQGLFYESSTGLWKNKSIATVLGYTPQAQLDGTGFVKASGTTITYDNSTYLTTTDAASTYQRLDKMVSNLLASATEYPNSNAVINALALKANAANPTFTGDLTISGATPRLYFVDTDQNPDYTVFIDSGFFYIYDQTAGATRLSINSSGNISTGTGKSITAGSFIKESGTASDFLKADGSIDSSTYVTSATLSSYLLSSTAASTYQRLDKMVSNLLASSTEYPNSNAVIAALALKANASNPVFTGDMTISGITPRLYFVDTDQNPDYTLFADAGYFYIYDQTAGATRFSINSSGNINSGVGKSITAGSFVKESGTSSQYLMADGSVTTGPSLSGYVPYTGATANVNLGTFGLTATSITDGYITMSLAQINRASSLVEIQYNAGGGVQFFGNTAKSILFASATGAATFSSSVQSARFYNTFVNASNNSRNSFQSFNLNEVSLTGGWVAADFGDLGTTSNRVVLGSGYGGKAIIAGHTGLLDNWASLYINPYGVGNVIIGTTTDAGYKLYVDGTGRFASSVTSSSLVVSNSTNAYLQLSAGNTGGNEAGIFFSNSGNKWEQYTAANDSRMVWYSYAASSIVASISSTGAATFSSSVTAGGTISATNADIYSQNGTGSNLSIGFKQSDAVKFRLRYDISGDTVSMVGSSGNFIQTWNQSGNVGIGTTSPGERFEVNGSIKATGRTVLATSTGGVSLGYESGIGYLETWNSSPLIVRTYNYQSFNISGTQALKINTNGNILINTDTDAGYRLFVNGGLAINTGSFHGILGSIQASWGGSTAYPTLYGNTADRWVMHINPHISYTQNGVNGYSGTTYGAMLRMAGNAAADMYWDLGVGVCSVGADKFAIGRNGTALFTITNAGNVTATAFFESSDMRIKTLIDGSAQIAGIENLEAKLYKKNGKMELGYFAQDVEKYMPYSVDKNHDGFLSLSYREVHTAKIARLEKRVAELEKQLNAA